MTLFIATKVDRNIISIKFLRQIFEKAIEGHRVAGRQTNPITSDRKYKFWERSNLQIFPKDSACYNARNTVIE